MTAMDVFFVAFAALGFGVWLGGLIGFDKQVTETQKSMEIQELDDRALSALFEQARDEKWKRLVARAAKDALEIRIAAQEAHAAALAESEAHPS